MVAIEPRRFLCTKRVLHNGSFDCRHPPGGAPHSAHLRKTLPVIASDCIRVVGNYPRYTWLLGSSRGSRGSRPARFFDVGVRWRALMSEYPRLRGHRSNDRVEPGRSVADRPVCCVIDFAVRTNPRGLSNRSPNVCRIHLTDEHQRSLLSQPNECPSLRRSSLDPAIRATKHCEKDRIDSTVFQVGTPSRCCRHRPHPWGTGQRWNWSSAESARSARS